MLGQRIRFFLSILVLAISSSFKLTAALPGFVEEDPANVTVIELKSNWRSALGENPRSVESDFDDSSWKAVTLPMSYAMNARFGMNGAGNTVIAWHRKLYHADPAIAAGRTFLKFNLSSDYEYDTLEVEVYVNGHSVRSGLEGKYEITAQLMPGADNVIAVRILWRGMFKQGARTLHFDQALLSIVWPKNYIAAIHTPDLKDPIEMALDGMDSSIAQAEPKTFDAAVGEHGTLRWQQLFFSSDGRVLGGTAHAENVGKTDRKPLNFIFRWNPKTGRKIEEQEQLDAMASASINSHGDRILIAPSINSRPLAIGESRLVRCASIWTTGRPIETAAFDPGTNALLLSLNASYDGRQSLGATAEGLYAWDLASRRQDPSSGTTVFAAPSKLITAGDWVGPAIFSPDGSVLAIATKTGVLEIWDTQRAAKIARCDDPSLKELVPSFMRISRDGSRMVALFGTSPSAGAGIGVVIDAKSGRLIARLGGGDSAFTAADIAADGSLVVTGSSDSAVTLWRGQDGEQLARYTDNGGAVAALAVSETAQIVAIGSASGALHLWDLTSTPFDSGHDQKLAALTSPAQVKPTTGIRLTPEKEAVYLLLRYRRLAAEATSKLMRGLKPGELAAMNLEVDDQARYAAEKKMPETFTAIAAELRGLIHQLNTGQEQRREFAAKLTKRNAEVAVLKAKIESEMKSDQLLGFAEVFIGAMCAEERLYNSATRETIVYRNEDGERIFRDGVMDLMKSGLDASSKLFMLNSAIRQEDDAARAAISTVRADQAKAVKSFEDTLQRLLPNAYEVTDPVAQGKAEAEKIGESYRRKRPLTRQR